MKETQNHPYRGTEFVQVGLSAPDPAVLASLAVQLCAAGIVTDKTMEAAVKCAALWWIEARLRCEKLADAEVLRLAAQSDIDYAALTGDMAEIEVMKLVEMETPDHFRRRAREFFDTNWNRPRKEMGDLEKRRQKLHANHKETLKFQASGEGGRRWHRGVALIFRAYLAVDRSEKASVGGHARQKRTANNAAVDSNPQAKNPPQKKSADVESKAVFRR